MFSLLACIGRHCDKSLGDPSSFFRASASDKSDYGLVALALYTAASVSRKAFRFRFVCAAYRLRTFARHLPKRGALKAKKAYWFPDYSHNKDPDNYRDGGSATLHRSQRDKEGCGQRGGLAGF
jgi:hypothetical protein